MVKKVSRHYLSKRSTDILKFLWRFKLATSSMIHQAFFSELTEKATYSNLHRLKIHKYIEVKTDEYGDNHVWVLTKKGFNLVLKTLPELEVEGYKSENQEHDILCSKVQLGDHLKETPKNVITVTEQELRTFKPEFLPEWVPNTEVHRPDGYWFFTFGENVQLMSLEVEISNKSFVRYKGYSYFYNKFPKNSRVLWVIRKRTQAYKILKAMYKYEPDYKIHNFVELKDFMQHGWRAEIFAGINRGQTIRELIESNIEVSSDLGRIPEFNRQVPNGNLTTLNNSPISMVQKIESADCMGISNEKA